MMFATSPQRSLNSVFWVSIVIGPWKLLSTHVGHRLRYPRRQLLPIMHACMRT